MKFDPKWIKIMGIAMSLPSTIFIMAWGSMHLHKIGILTQLQAVLLFLAVVCNMLFLMVYYAFKRKN
jgi:purine-cytosine permease-like protein